MDDVDATRVATDAARKKVKRYAISLRVATAFSANHVAGLLLELLPRRGVEVLTLRGRMDQEPLVQYDKPRGQE